MKTKNNKKRILLCLLLPALIAVLLCACGCGTNEKEPAASPEPLPVYEPTAIPVPPVFPDEPYEEAEPEAAFTEIPRYEQEQPTIPPDENRDEETDPYTEENDTPQAGMGEPVYGIPADDPGLTAQQVITPSVFHPLLSEGLLILPKDTAEGEEIRIDVCFPGYWNVYTQNTPGTEDWLFIAGGQGSGSGQIVFTVQQIPGDDSNFKTRDTFATLFTVTGENGECVFFTVALTKDAAFPNDHINTGDYREDMIAVALTQVGFQSSSVKADYDGILDPGSRRGDCNKYAKYMGINGNPWCASFVSWCFFQAGVPEEILTSCTEANPGGLSPRVKHGEVPVYYMAALNDTQSNNHKYLKKYGIRVEHEECSPQRGDLIFFRKKGASLSTTFTHLGIVLDHTDGIITYIDGNGGDEDTVKINTIEYNDSYIVAWFTPW